MKPTYDELEARLSAAENNEIDARCWISELKAQVKQLAAENVYLLPKAASELSNAWVLHKYLIGIQAAIMYLDNGNKKDAQEWLYGTIAGPGFEFPDGVDDIEAWATHQMRGSISHPRALEIIKSETPATDAYLSQLRNDARAEIAVMMDGHAARYDALAKQTEDFGVDNRYRYTAAMFRGVAKELREGKAGEVQS